MGVRYLKSQHLHCYIEQIAKLVRFETDTLVIAIHLISKMTILSYIRTFARLYMCELNAEIGLTVNTMLIRKSDGGKHKLVFLSFLEHVVVTCHLIDRSC